MTFWSDEVQWPIRDNKADKQAINNNRCWSFNNEKEEKYE